MYIFVYLCIHLYIRQALLVSVSDFFIWICFWYCLWIGRRQCFLLYVCNCEPVFVAAIAGWWYYGEQGERGWRHSLGVSHLSTFHFECLIGTICLNDKCIPDVCFTNMEFSLKIITYPCALFSNCNYVTWVGFRSCRHVSRMVRISGIYRHIHSTGIICLWRELKIAFPDEPSKE